MLSTCRTLGMMLAVFIAILLAGGCGLVPAFPGAAQRLLYLQQHPETPPRIAAAIKDGQVARGMTLAQVHAVAGADNCHRGWSDYLAPKFSTDSISYTQWSGTFWLDGDIPANVQDDEGILLHAGDVTLQLRCNYTHWKQLLLVWDKTQDKLIYAGWEDLTPNGPPMSTSTICDAYGCTTINSIYY